MEQGLMESTVAKKSMEKFTKVKPLLLRDIQECIVNFTNYTDLQKHITFLENTEVKFPKNKPPKKKSPKIMKVSMKRCQSYIQNGRQCSRNVKDSEKIYCGLHNLQPFGNMQTGFLNKNCKKN